MVLEAKANPLQPTIASPYIPGGVNVLARQMDQAWEEGKPLLVEDLLQQNPRLANKPQAVIQLIYHEWSLRRQAGEQVSVKEWQERFPRWQSELQFVLGASSDEGKSLQKLPELGQIFAGFRLLAELGHGAQGRVFLAAELSLGERLVVLKVSICDGREHLSLARLQHTHIVPLYGMRDFPEHNLRALVMPYMGAVTLAEILDGLHDRPLAELSGTAIVELLDCHQAGMPVTLPSEGPARKFLVGASHVRAVCWLGACLADALHYAHARNLVHLDLKPSNILIAADGQPMLLDFHLAQAPLKAGQPCTTWFGGTPRYMAPEHEDSFQAVSKGNLIPHDIDGRSDLYALGVILFESLTRTYPPPDATARLLRQQNPSISEGLAAIILKCLARNPDDRYQTAAELAADLRRHLNDEPLRGVRNSSLAERWRKWRRRRPHALPLMALVLALVVTLLVGGNDWLGKIQERRRGAEMALQAGQQQMRDRQFKQAFQSLTYGLSLAESAPGADDLRQALTNHQNLARRALAAHELAGRASLTRFLSSADSAPPNALWVAEVNCQQTWQMREVLLHPANTDARLEAGLEQRIRADLLDLAICWATIKVRLAGPAEKKDACWHALALLGEAEALLGANPVLVREQLYYARALALDKKEKDLARRAAGLPPRTAWDHYALGRLLLRSDDLYKAYAALNEGARLEPHGFWPNYYRGLCAHRLEKLADAREAFSVCVGQAPGCAEAFLQRGMVYAALGDSIRARNDFDRALQLQPSMTAAALQRKLLLQQGSPQAAPPVKQQASSGAGK